MTDPAPTAANYPPLGIFEVRRELEPHTDIRRFDISIDVELTRAASLEQFQRGLRQWLRAALVAKKPTDCADSTSTVEVVTSTNSKPNGRPSGRPGPSGPRSRR